MNSRPLPVSPHGSARCRYLILGLALGAALLAGAALAGQQAGGLVLSDWPKYATPPFDSGFYRHWGEAESANTSGSHDASTGAISALADATNPYVQCHAEAGVVWNFSPASDEAGKAYVKITDYYFSTPSLYAYNTGFGGGTAMALLWLEIVDTTSGDRVSHLVRRDGNAVTGFGPIGMGSYVSTDPTVVEFKYGHDYEIRASVEAYATHYAECPSNNNPTNCQWGNAYAEVEAVIHEITAAPAGRPWINVRFGDRTRIHDAEIDTWDAYELLLQNQGESYFNDSLTVTVCAGGEYDPLNSWVQIECPDDVITDHDAGGLLNPQICGGGDTLCLTLPSPGDLPWWGGRWEVAVEVDPEIDQFQVGNCYVPFPFALFLADDQAAQLASGLLGVELADLYDYQSWQVEIADQWQPLPDAIDAGHAWSVSDPAAVALAPAGGLTLQQIFDLVGFAYTAPTFDELWAWLAGHCRGWDAPPNPDENTPVNPFFRFGANSYAEPRTWRAEGYVEGTIDGTTYTDGALDHVHLQVNWDYWPRTLFQIPAAAPVPTVAGFDLGGFPNPFNPRIRFDFALPMAAPAHFAIHDLTGRRVVTLLDGPQRQGPASVSWDGRDAAGRVVPAGVYVARLVQGHREETLKVSLLK